MTKGRKVSVAVALLVLGALAAAAFVVSLPTNSPPQYQLDFLAIGSAAYKLHDEVRGRELRQEDLQAAISGSGSLIRSARIERPGIIMVAAVMAPKGAAAREGSITRAPVEIRFELVEDVGGKSRWVCSGKPQPALPAFCGAL